MGERPSGMSLGEESIRGFRCSSTVSPVLVKGVVIWCPPLVADFSHKLKYDTVFRQKLEAKIARVAHLERVGRNNTEAQQEMAKLCLQILRMSDFNAGLLTPLYYPKFSESGMPLSLMDRPFALPFFDIQVGGSITNRAGRQVGKCAAGKTKCQVLMDGSPDPQTTTAQELFELCKASGISEKGTLGKDVAEEITLLSGKVKINTPTGWKDVWKAFITVPLPIWRMATEGDLFLEGAPEHIVILDDGEECMLQDLLPGDVVRTVAGNQTVTDCFEVFRPDEQMYDFEVQGPEHVYYTEGILSHNSTTLVARQRIYMDMLRNFKSMYITTHTSYLKSYGNRFKAMEKMFAYPIKDPTLRQNLYFKEYPFNNQVEMIRVFETADEARSRTCSELIIDEAQHFDPDFESVTDQCLKSSKIPARYYAGTSLTMDTFLEGKYQEGSKATWFIPSPNGKDWIDCGDEDMIMKCIKPEGLVCPWTGKLLQVTDGEYVHADMHAYDCGLVSYHTPQIIVPEYANNVIKWTEIFRDFKNYSRMRFLQEVMGIPQEEGSREISIQDLQDMCQSEEGPGALEAKAQRGYYKFVVSGCDWGGSDYNPVEKTKLSFTAHVVIGVTPDSNIDILHMKKYAGMDYHRIAKYISEDHKRFRGNVLASDAGAGVQYNTYLRESGYILQEKHLILRYMGPQTKLFTRSKDGSGMPNEYQINKSEAVTAVFEAIKRKPLPRIRCYDWRLAQKELMDFLNVYRNLVETETGGQKFRWRRHGSKSDDTLHALAFAYITARVLMNEPLIEDRQMRDSLFHLLMGGSLRAPAASIYSGISG